MTFSKYIESVAEHFEAKDRNYKILSLVSDTANLIEKIRYFKSDNSLVLSELGDVIFRTFSVMAAFDIPLDENPLDLEMYKSKTDELDRTFVISEDELIQSVILELGIVSNIITTNLKYDIHEYNEEDVSRLRKSLYSYILYTLILCCKYNFSIDRVLDFNINKLRATAKELNMKKVDG